MTVILDPSKRWQCPACDLQYVTREARPHTPMHPCSKMNGLLAPYVEVTGLELDHSAVRLVRVDRDDYVGGDIVRTDAEGRPAAAVLTERADGSNDCHAFASTASATGGAS